MNKGQIAWAIVVPIVAVLLFRELPAVGESEAFFSFDRKLGGKRDRFFEEQREKERERGNAMFVYAAVGVWCLGHVLLEGYRRK